MNRKTESKIRNNFEDALKRLDYTKAANIMDYLNWCWWGNNYPPTHKQMLESIKESFEYAIEGYKNDYICCGSGGFSVTIYKNGKIRIQFVPVESYSFD